jgi:hypothetical protein
VLSTLSVIIAGIALAVSVIVFLDNRIRQIRATRLARKPALVFTWDPDRQTWMLNNIGSGPALDVVILQRIEGSWCHPLRMPEMAVDDANTVPRRWSERWHTNPGLGARYRSITGEEYATKTGGDYSEITEGWGKLRPDAARVEPHWHYRS